MAPRLWASTPREGEARGAFWGWARALQRVLANNPTPTGLRLYVVFCLAIQAASLHEGRVP
eukprot:3174584-Pleurochrysis_carterae.AAC.1